MQGACLPHDRLLRLPPSGIFLRSFPLHSPRYARETIAGICSLGPAVTRAARTHRRSGAALAGSPCDARVAPLATAIMSQTGSSDLDVVFPQVSHSRSVLILAH